MEFNILQHFKGLENMPKDPFNGDEIGTSLFLTGNMGPRISEKMDGYAAKAGMSRRNFLKSSVGFSAAMLAANEVTGMKFFEVGEAEAADGAARSESIQLARASSDFIVDVHTHVCTRPGPLRRRPEHHHARHVVRQPAGRSRQSLRSAQRHQRHDGRELRQADPEGKRHHRRYLQSVRLPRGLRRARHDPDGISGARCARTGRSPRSCWPAVSHRTRV